MYRLTFHLAWGWPRPRSRGVRDGALTSTDITVDSDHHHHVLYFEKKLTDAT